MSIARFAALAVAAALAMSGVARAQIAPDPAAAEPQYRLGQRLAADGSPGAVSALERVVTLDPHGPFADDALVDLAKLKGAPDWPEDLGGLDAVRAAAARGLLEKVVNEFAGGDRALEARYRLALIGMAPVPGRDGVRARQDLIAVAANPSRERWVAAARYALGVLDERSGASDRAAGAFARIVVERPDGDVGARARAGFGRILLVEERFGDAAGWLQQAIEGGAPPGLRAESQVELALREVIRQRVPGRRWTAIATPLAVVATSRGASLLTTSADGRIVVFDRKGEALRIYDLAGGGAEQVPLSDATALATDPFGRVFVATKDKLLRWDPTGLTVVSDLANFGSPSAIAPDASGAVWIADRKGDKIARWDPGTPGPIVVRESKGAGVAALVVAGGRAIAAEEKTGRVVALSGSGTETALAAAVFRRPIALAVDAAGRICVLDEKAETVTRLTPKGEVSDVLSLGAGGVSHALALAAAPDGAVRILSGSTGAVAVVP